SSFALDVKTLAGWQAAGFLVGTFVGYLWPPPFHDARRQNVSPDARRRLAHVAEPGLLQRWVATAAWLLKPRGVLTLIWRADGLEDVVGGLQPAFGEIAVLPVPPRPNKPARRVLVRSTKARYATQMDYPPLSLNDEHGQPTATAEAILRGGKTLTISEM